MAKIIKRKKQKRFRIEGFVSLLFFVALISWFATQTLLKTVQVDMIVQQKEISNQIADLENENSTLEIKIQSLQRGERISASIEGDGLNSYSNITQIGQGD